jgi:hypothetical protein
MLPFPRILADSSTSSRRVVGSLITLMLSWPRAKLQMHKSAAERLPSVCAKKDDTQETAVGMISRRRLAWRARPDGMESVSTGRAALQAPADWTECSPLRAESDGDWQAKLVPNSGPTLNTPLEHAGPHADGPGNGKGRRPAQRGRGRSCQHGAMVNAFRSRRFGSCPCRVCWVLPVKRYWREGKRSKG